MPSHYPSNNNVKYWILGIIIIIAGITLQNILFPFIFAAVIAYLCDPICDALEKRGYSRLIATIIVCLLAFSIIALLFISLLPILIIEIQDFIKWLPSALNDFKSLIANLPQWLETNFQPIFSKDLLTDQLNNLTDNAISSIKGLASNISVILIEGTTKGIQSIINLFSTMIMIPIITFYLLWDWDVMTKTVRTSAPKTAQEDIKLLGEKINLTIAGFIRGQGLVCITLGLTIGISLSLIGLNFGFITGLLTGLFSFVPYIAMFVGFFVAIILAIVEFGNWLQPVLVCLVFAGAQILETSVLSPKLVGERINLHPVWVLFAVFAGAELFGFWGVLISVPSAAVLGVIVRYFYSSENNT